jgi:hypothetical protein
MSAGPRPLHLPLHTTLAPPPHVPSVAVVPPTSRDLSLSCLLTTLSMPTCRPANASASPLKPASVSLLMLARILCPTRYRTHYRTHHPTLSHTLSHTPSHTLSHAVAHTPAPGVPVLLDARAEDFVRGPAHPHALQLHHRPHVPTRYEVKPRGVFGVCVTHCCVLGVKRGRVGTRRTGDGDGAVFGCWLSTPPRPVALCCV